jgi:hypothetical protein
MNPLPTVTKSVLAISTAYAAAKNPDVRRKCREMVMDLASGMCPAVSENSSTVASPSPILSVVDAAGVSVAVSAPDAVGSKESVSEGADPEIEGDLPGTSGTFYHETALVAAPVELIGGWPVRGAIDLTGLAPNRRMLKGRLEDGRVVSVERRVGAVGRVTGRLMMAGVSPLYRVVV